MEAVTKRRGDATGLDLESELETWDWARTAGISADELHEILQALLPHRELRKAA